MCNDAGKMIGLPLNRPIFDDRGVIVDIVTRTFLICGAPMDSGAFHRSTRGSDRALHENVLTLIGGFHHEKIERYYSHAGRTEEGISSTVFKTSSRRWGSDDEMKILNAEYEELFGRVKTFTLIRMVKLTKRKLRKRRKNSNS